MAWVDADRHRPQRMLLPSDELRQTPVAARCPPSAGMLAGLRGCSSPFLPSCLAAAVPPLRCLLLLPARQPCPPAAAPALLPLPLASALFCSAPHIPASSRGLPLSPAPASPTHPWPQAVSSCLSLSDPCGPCPLAHQPGDSLPTLDPGSRLCHPPCFPKSSLRSRLWPPWVFNPVRWSKVRG